MFNKADGTVIYSKVSSAVQNNGVWHHLVAIFDTQPASEGLTLVIDGNIESTVGTDNRAGSNYTDGSGPVGIGASYNAAWEYFFPGTIDEVAIYPTALTTTRATDHYNARLRTTCSSQTVLANSTWYHIAGIWNNASTTLNLFVNGTQECSIVNSAGAYSGSSNELGIAASLTGSSPNAGSYWKGAIADLRAFSSALSTSILQKIYNTTKSRFDSWTPSNLTGLTLWLDANDLTTLYKTSDCTTTAVTANNDAVACWKDKSGTHHAIQTGAGKPIYKTNQINTDLPVIQFTSASSQSLNVGTVIGKPANWTLFVVFNTTNITTRQTVLSSNDSNGTSATTWGTVMLKQTGRPNGSINYSFSDGTGSGSADTPGVLVNNTFVLLSERFGTGQSLQEIFVNGVAQTLTPGSLTATTSSGTAYDLSIGKLGEYNGLYLDGKIAEIIIYTNALSTTDIKRVEAYLNNKYQIY